MAPQSRPAVVVLQAASAKVLLGFLPAHDASNLGSQVRLLTLFLLGLHLVLNYRAAKILTRWMRLSLHEFFVCLLGVFLISRRLRACARETLVLRVPPAHSNLDRSMTPQSRPSVVVLRAASAKVLLLDEVGGPGKQIVGVIRSQKFPSFGASFYSKALVIEHP